MRRVVGALVLLVAVACGSSSSSDDAQPPPVDVPDAGDEAAAGPAQIRILAINDFHGNLEPPSGSNGTMDGAPAGGAAFLAAHLAKLRTPNTVVVSSGDLSGASPLVSGLFKDEPAVQVMNALGLDLNGVGNHEFDRGRAELLRLSGLAKFHYLAANVNDENKQTIFRPYEIKTIDGEKIAFVGMTLEDTKSIVPADGVKGLTFENEVATINALVPRMKAEGAAAIVALLHQGDVPPNGQKSSDCGIEGGFLDQLVSGMDKAVTIVHSAHTHAPYVCKLGSRLVTSASSYGRVITEIDLEIDRTTHAVKSKTAKNVVVTRDVTPDPDVASIVANYETQAAPLANKVVGHLSGDLSITANLAGESPMGDVIADAQLEATKGDGAVIAFTNSGGIRADLKAGAVTYAQAFGVQPFQNDLVTMDLTGDQLKTLLEAQFSGGGVYLLQVSDSLHYTYKSATSPHVDPATITVGGVAFDPAKTYRITVSSYLAGGGDGFTIFTKGTNAKTGVVDIDAFTAYLGAHDPLTPPTPARVTQQ